MWTESSLLCDRAIRIVKSQTYLFADLVLCLKNISPEPVQGWKYKIKWFLETRYLNEVDRIDGEPMELEWKISQDSLHWEFSLRFKRWWQNYSVNLSSFKEELSSCPCTMTLYGELQEMKKIV